MIFFFLFCCKPALSLNETKKKWLDTTGVTFPLNDTQEDPVNYTTGAKTDGKDKWSVTDTPNWPLNYFEGGQKFSGTKIREDFVIYTVVTFGDGSMFTLGSLEWWWSGNSSTFINDANLNDHEDSGERLPSPSFSGTKWNNTFQRTNSDPKKLIGPSANIELNKHFKP